MKILAFDTAGNGCSVCLWDDGQVLAKETMSMAHGQAERLIPMIDSVQQRAGVAWDALDRLAVTVGPGSFTGLRVGLATAQGLTLAVGVPVIGITTLEAYAARAAADGVQGPLLVVVDARRDDLYLQAFIPSEDGLQAVAPPTAAPVCEVAGLLHGWGLTAVTAIGDAADLVADVTGVQACVQQGMVCAATVAALAAGRTAQDAPAIPLYIRPPDAALPKDGGQVRPDV